MGYVSQLVSLMLPSISAVDSLPADDRYRVELPLIPHSEGSDYYHAVYIDVRLGACHVATVIQYMIACCMHVACCSV